MSTSEIIAALVVFLSLGGALENFGKIPFFWKLVAIALGGTVVLWVAARRLSTWVKRRSALGFTGGNSAYSKARYAAAAVILGSIYVVFATFAWLVVCFYTMSVEEIAGPNIKLEFWIRGAVQLADKVSVQLPPRMQTRCALVDPTGDSRHRAEVAMVDWNTQNPQLQFSNFSYPQRQGVRCTPRVDLNRVTVRVEPPLIEVFFSGRRRNYNEGIVIVGGALWIIALVFLWFRSR